MTAPDARARPVETVTVRYWAGARAAAGTAQDVFDLAEITTLADVVRRVLGAHPEPQMAKVVAVCSVLVGDLPAGTRAREDVAIEPGDVVELLPPFAGG